MSILPPSDRPPAGILSGHVEAKVSRKRFLSVDAKTEKAAQRALTHSSPAGLPFKHNDEKVSRRRFIPPPTGKIQEPRAERKSADRPPAGIPSGHIEGKASRRRSLLVEAKTEAAAQRALARPVPRLDSEDLFSRHNDEQVLSRSSIPSPTGKAQELRTEKTELERCQEEFDALPFLDFTVQPITKREAIDIAHRRAQLKQPEITRDYIASRNFFFSYFSDTDSFNSSKEGGCLEMRGICNFTPHTTLVNQTDYALELEAYFTTPYPHLLDYALGPAGHNPWHHPRNLVFGCSDFVQTTLSLVEEEPSFAENEVVCQCEYPALIIRVKSADRKLLQYDSVTNEYKELLAGNPDQFKMEQYNLIKKECEKTDARILGKMIVVQRVVHRHGELILEKGVRGHLVEIGRVNAKELLKTPP